MTETAADRVQHALEVLLEGAGDASRVVSGAAAGLSLPEITTAVDAVLDVMDMVGQMIGAASDRVEEIGAREITERSDGSDCAALEDAALHLSYGRDALTAGRALLAVGLGEMRRVERRQ